VCVRWKARKIYGAFHENRQTDVGGGTKLLRGRCGLTLTVDCCIGDRYNLKSVKNKKRVPAKSFK